MSYIKIETLTPVHIGSGNLLYNNTDFVQVNIDNEPHIAVISEEKIWKLLDEQHLDNWLTAIAKRENLKEFLKRFAPEAKSKDYAKRRMPLYCRLKENDTLKETIHNGLGFPYIPGSSIKGAIRTAILASLANNVQKADDKIIVKIKDRDGNFVPKKDKYGNILVNADKIEQEVFGKDPNSDVFRFIQAGDAYFEKETEIATRIINLNIRQSGNGLRDTSKPQIVEAIGTEEESTFQLKVSKEYYDFVKRNYPQVGNLPVFSISDLFCLINEHTKKLVEDEINYWSEIEKTEGEDYVEEMQKILQQINNCGAGKSCVLRIGHASGWRFITGAWTEKLTNFKDVVVPASRRSNENYKEYKFPKTRRLDEDSYVLGFVKLTM
ncbi:MAG: type III-A CRISPR-associated RAMP protein Csm5 [Candidatus Azobacteroides sp.]|nr:type III-A CRISPR-associated RAMP protein Csm5 [Candidatus Azobacteroides sp.]